MSMMGWTDGWMDERPSVWGGRAVDDDDDDGGYEGTAKNCRCAFLIFP